MNFKRENFEGKQSGASQEKLSSQAEKLLLLYRAAFHILLQDSEQQVFTLLGQALQQAQFASALLLPGKESVQMVNLWNSDDVQIDPKKQDFPFDIHLLAGLWHERRLIRASELAEFIHAGPSQEHALAANELLKALSSAGGSKAVLVPAITETRDDPAAESTLTLEGLLILWPAHPDAPDLRALAPKQVEPFRDILISAVRRLAYFKEQQAIQRKLAEQEVLWNISQAISLETDLESLFHTIHDQVEAVMGSFSSFAISLYDAQSNMIRIPYMVEEGQRIQVPPFPLGEGLTSIVIHTRRPLLLESSTEARARALGAKFVGAPAKSWLGVPLLHSSEVIGAILVQDIREEYRFGEEDLRLLTTLASQVAVVVHNARLLERTRRQAEQERLLNELNRKLFRSVDMQSILKITADELGAAIGAHRAQIEIKGLE